MYDFKTFRQDDLFPRCKVAVIGSGYVGLTLAACLALRGHEVACSDVSSERVALLSNGQAPIVEDGLPEIVDEMLESGRLRFGTDNVAVASWAEIIFLCLPTPQGGDGEADLSFVCTVAEEIGSYLRTGAIVVNKSTVPVGTAKLVMAALGRDDVHVASNPEFLAEGSAVRDFLAPDRVVIGADLPEVGQRVAHLYEGLEGELIITDVLSAELTKYAANAYLATRLTFVNSIAEMCESVGADVRQVMKGVGADRRIGPSFLRPGPGWGGSCFPKDTQALVRTADLVGCDLALVKTAIAKNADHTERIIGKVVALAGGAVEGERIALWGLTFKAGTDDLRSSPALSLAERLIELGALVNAYDPTVFEPLPDITLHASPIAACEGAIVLLIATEWDEFARVNLEAVGTVMASPMLVDARNMIDPRRAESAGFGYIGVGVGTMPVLPRSSDEVAA